MRLTSRICRQSSRLVSSAGTKRTMPAFATSTSRPPAFAASATPASTASSEATSNGTARAVTLARELVHRTVELAHVAQRDRRAVLAEAPGGGESDPRAAPVTSARLPFRRPSGTGHRPEGRPGAAVDPQRRPGHVRGLVGGQPRDEGGDVLSRAEPARGRQRPASGDSAWCSKPTGRSLHARHDVARAHGVGADAMRSAFRRKEARRQPRRLPSSPSTQGSRGSRGCPSRSRCGSSSRRPARAWSRNRHGRRGTAP